MTTFGLTPEGFVPKSLAQIEADIVARQRGSLGANLDTSPFSIVGQLNGIIASAIAECWETNQTNYDALDPDKASGAQQDALYALTNTFRLGPKKSRVTAVVNLAAGVNVAPGDAVASVEGNPTARFTNAEPMVNAGGTSSNFEVVFEAEVAGEVVANAGTLTVIETFIGGWNSITNDADAALGSGIESDAAYRIRRLVELTAPGGGTVSGIRADLARVPDVVAVEVLENETDTIVDGLPPHSIEAIVRGGDAQAIAESIYSNKIGGIRTQGSEPVVSVLDDRGDAHDVYFSRPAEVPVFMAIEIETGPGYVNAQRVRAAIRAAFIDKLNPAYLDVGTSVYAGRIVCIALEVPGVLNARVGLATSVITDADAGALSIVISQRQLATVAADANIAVVEL
jgi:uncharacterized phage protein gp47/JayE